MQNSTSIVQLKDGIVFQVSFEFFGGTEWTADYTQLTGVPLGAQGFLERFGEITAAADVRAQELLELFDSRAAL